MNSLYTLFLVVGKRIHKYCEALLLLLFHTHMMCCSELLLQQYIRNTDDFLIIHNNSFGLSHYIALLSSPQINPFDNTNSNKSTADKQHVMEPNTSFTHVPLLIYNQMLSPQNIVRQ